jgi:hypothetical protein
MREATRLQRETLHHLDAFTGVHGRPPSWAELGALIGGGKEIARRRVHWMQKKGLLEGRALTTLGRVTIESWLAQPSGGTVPSGGTAV